VKNRWSPKKELAGSKRGNKGKKDQNGGKKPSLPEKGHPTGGRVLGSVLHWENKEEPAQFPAPLKGVK